MTAKSLGLILKSLLFATTITIPFRFSLSEPVWAVEAAASSAPAIQEDSLVTIESDVQQADNQTGIVTATGNVKITYPEKGMVATSKQAQYFSKEGRLILSGDVDVIDSDGQRIRAERLVYQLDQERLLAQPAQGKQVMSKLKLNSPTPQKEPGFPVP
ncbi:MAG: LPS-assembly protein LptD [Cyanobacteriota bacterium]|nr:LPS-assembly protein LptD [Cyanobacteriota bacterium]